MEKTKLHILIIIIFTIIIIASAWWFFSRTQQSVPITTFEECVSAGNPVMESYPRQCRAGEKTFTELIKTSSLSEAEARVIAEKSCIKGGEALDLGIYNENSKTWWFDANLNASRPGCHPACVVSVETKTAEINWRCTGLKESK